MYAAISSSFLTRICIPFLRFKVQCCESLLCLMLTLTFPVQTIAMFYLSDDIILHIRASSWNNTAVHWMFLLNEWISKENYPFTISYYILQVRYSVLILAIHFGAKSAVVTISYFLFSYWV